MPRVVISLNSHNIEGGSMRSIRIFVENHNFAPASKDNRSELLLLRVRSCKVYEVEPGAESGPYDYAKPLVMMWKLNCFALGTPKTFYMEENSPLMTKIWGTPEISSMKNPLIFHPSSQS
ncbi:hypothetical protein K435DRAFT_792668 [Dendrothele bispora CBS 962.96]|uniref:Uncharacterized protein n=1 Tax=Dendrothele bispora (strain CBS 962.96) TaxID=1314807 RepID=A0A4S8MIT5_DENBC|nr:hypothetical protein K435DRAFT_792668 [Dendrothele bispora CBS 962.96]